MALIAGSWFHHLRRSLVTRACKAGIAERVVMRMTGHRTRDVFDRNNITDEGDLKAAAPWPSAGQRSLGPSGPSERELAGAEDSRVEVNKRSRGERI